LVLEKLLNALGCESGSELGVLITDDREISELNNAYRKKPKPTDVLSFSLREGRGSEYRNKALGDVVISLETALCQAREQRVPVTEELLRLVIHGTLHLVGYDHENVSREKARLMRKKECELFELLAQFALP